MRYQEDLASKVQEWAGRDVSESLMLKAEDSVGPDPGELTMPASMDNPHVCECIHMLSFILLTP